MNGATLAHAWQVGPSPPPSRVFSTCCCVGVPAPECQQGSQHHLGRAHSFHKKLQPASKPCTRRDPCRWPPLYFLGYFPVVMVMQLAGVR
jgi:hypothetical protein